MSKVDSILIDVVCPHCFKIVQVQSVKRFSEERNCNECKKDFYIGAMYTSGTSHQEVYQKQKDILEAVKLNAAEQRTAENLKTTVSINLNPIVLIVLGIIIVWWII